MPKDFWDRAYLSLRRVRGLVSLIVGDAVGSGRRIGPNDRCVCLVPRENPSYPIPHHFLHTVPRGTSSFL